MPLTLTCLQFLIPLGSGLQLLVLKVLYITKHQPTLCRQKEFYNLHLFNFDNYTVTEPDLIQEKKNLTRKNSRWTFIFFPFFPFSRIFPSFILFVINSSHLFLFNACLSQCFSDKTVGKNGPFWNLESMLSFKLCQTFACTIGFLF